jgi:hypothetical protein
MSKNMKSNRILWVTSTPPAPINAGNRRHLNYLIQMLKKRGAVMDFVLYGWEKEATGYRVELESMFNRYIHVPQTARRQMKFSNYWGIDDWAPEELLAAVKEFAAGQHYDAVFVVYVWMSRVLELFGDNVVKVIDTQDIFTSRDELFLSQGIEKKWFYTREDEEAKGLARADIVLGITGSDCEFFHGVLRKRAYNVKVMPCGTGVAVKNNGKGRVHDAKHALTLGYMASANALNQEAARRFFSALNVCRLGGGSFTLVVAGAISSYISNYDNINVHPMGFVEDPDEFYNEVDVIVAPMVDGTGLKIKTIEAIEYGKPFMATRQATNDIPVSSMWHAVPTIELLAKHLGIWLEGEAGHARETTLAYLTFESKRLQGALIQRQGEYEDQFWEEFEGRVKSNSRAL